MILLEIHDFFGQMKALQFFYVKNFLYLDPPYLITFGEYNKFWNEIREEELLSCLDLLTKKKVNWALSNVTDYIKVDKKLQNKILKKWMKKYNLKKDFFISGGIGLHSIDSLFDLLKMDLPIYGIDVNSKFEDNNYLKKAGSWRGNAKRYVSNIQNEVSNLEIDEEKIDKEIKKETKKDEQ